MTIDNVYILWKCFDYEEPIILGIFDSKLHAEDAKKKYLKEHELWDCESLDVEKYELNKLGE
jgi:hypothetical protein